MPPYSKVTPEEHLALEFHYQSQNKESFSILSNSSKKKICDDLGKGWEWNNKFNDKSIGCNRLRGWWRCRSIQETKERIHKSEAKDPSLVLEKNQSTSKKTILQERHDSFTSCISVPEDQGKSYSLKNNSVKKGKKVKKSQLQKISTLNKSKAKSSSSKSPTIVTNFTDTRDQSKMLTPRQVIREETKENVDVNVNVNSIRADLYDEWTIQDDIEDREGGRSDYYYTDDEIHTRQANSINENSDIIFLQPKRLQIGTWNRLNQNSEVERELNVYYSPDEEAFVFWTCHAGRFFRIILPLYTLSSLKVFNSTTSSNLVLLFALNSNASGIYGVYFETSTTSEPQWVPNQSGDFSEDRQASTTGIYSLEINGLDEWNLALQHILLSILKASEPHGAELVRDFTKKVYWGDWEEEESTPEELVDSMNLPKESIEEFSKSLVYANSTPEGGRDLVLSSVYQYLKSEEFDAQASGMEEVKESLLGEDSDSEFEQDDQELYHNVNLPSSSPQPSLYHSRSSSYEYDFDSPFYNGSQNPHPHYSYPSNNPLETYSDSIEPPITTYGRYLNSQLYHHDDLRSSNGPDFLAEEYYPRVVQEDFHHYDDLSDVFHNLSENHGNLLKHY